MWPEGRRESSTEQMVFKEQKKKFSKLREQGAGRRLSGCSDSKAQRRDKSRWEMSGGDSDNSMPQTVC